MPGDLFSKQRGEQIIANHGKATRRADGRRTERTARIQTRPGLVTTAELQTSQDKFICADGDHTQCPAAVFWPRLGRIPCKNKEYPSPKTLMHNISA